MSEFELHQLLYEAIAEGRAHFDWWLTVSFATLVAGHYTFANLTRSVQYVVLTLYSLVSIALILRWNDARLVIIEYITQLIEMDAYVPFNTGAALPATVLQAGIMFFGTLAIVIFAVRVQATTRNGETALDQDRGETR